MYLADFVKVFLTFATNMSLVYHSSVIRLYTYASMLKTSSSINSYFLYKIIGTLPPSLKLNVRICAEDVQTLMDRGGGGERKREI
jgi:hypothetical protein